jgi:tetratricopeptide (TPR) repeat protein
LEGIAQIHRQQGAYDSAYALFDEAAGIAAGADDRRGHAWALRGLADIVSARDGDVERALALLSEAEATCREMRLSSALAYNHKMRGNVYYRAGRYAEARDTYSRLLAGALGLAFFVYVIVNGGMIAGLLPVVGVPMPLLSYGGTSAVSLLAGLGVVMAVNAHRPTHGH